MEREYDYDNPMYAHLKPYAEMQERLVARALEVAQLGLNTAAGIAVLNSEFGLELDPHRHKDLLENGFISVMDIYQSATAKQQREYHNSPRVQHWHKLSEGYDAGLWRLLAHELSEIQRLADDPVRVRRITSFLSSMLRDVLIGDKTIPALFLNEYVCASLHVYRNARAGKPTQVVAYDAERNAIHEAILQYADEERGSDWEKLLEKELAKRCNESLDADAQNAVDRN